MFTLSRFLGAAAAVAYLIIGRLTLSAVRHPVAAAIVALTCAYLALR